jgi:hypothetical protein
MKTIIVMALIFLVGCASPYQPHGFGGGYSETQLDENVFQVSFRGNGYTSHEHASDLCLLRSAEIAKQHDFAYFIIVDRSNSVTQFAYTTPKTTTTTANVNTYGNANISRNNINYNSTSSGTATSYTTGGQTYIFSKPKTINTIVCFKDKPQTDGLVFNVDFLLKSLSEKYNVKLKTP